MTDRLESGEGQRWGAPVDAPSGEATGDDSGEDVDATEQPAAVTVPA
uniref:Uncharacterized protein n=1 Tax=Janibacter limosus TaxID=53458 RepID=A0AC61U1J1_9MICO|nr:hypothetical protein [Janibacter limosus]